MGEAPTAGPLPTGADHPDHTDGDDDQFVDLLDVTMLESSPIAARVVAILQERGWRGWTRIEQIPADRLARGRRSGEGGAQPR